MGTKVSFEIEAELAEDLREFFWERARMRREEWPLGTYKSVQNREMFQKLGDRLDAAIARSTTDL